MHAVTASVPTRLDLSGGTLDVWPIHLALPEPAVTVNVALGVRARARVTPRSDDQIVLRSADLGEAATYPSLEALRGALRARTAELALLAHAVDLSAPSGGLELETYAESPSGAGLGGSSALLVAILAALHAAEDRALGQERLHALAQDAETSMLRALTGYQDYQPPIYGGLLALEGRPGGLVVERLEGVPLSALARRLRLLYTGAPHVSGITNWGVARAFFDGEDHTVDALYALAELSRLQRDAFRVGDLDQALALAVEDGRLRRTMAPGVVTPTILDLDAAARAAGALGTKICGAGGGGCVLVILPDEGAADPVDRWLATLPASGPVRALPVTLPSEGLQIRVEV